MRKEGFIQNVIIVVLAVTILVMSVGYALYNQSLEVDGTATFTKAKWDVHFDTSTFQETSTIKASNKSVGTETISYEVTLPAPGSEYSFKVDAKNFGTIDAKMTKITLGGVASTDKFIEYKVSYNGNEYTSTTDGLTEALAADASHELIVTVKYILPTDPADLPTETDKTLNLTVSLDYEDNVS